MPIRNENTGPNDTLALQACVFNLVQASRQFHKNMVKILRKIGFTGGDSDPCLFMRKIKLGVCYIEIYVDDNLLIRHEVAITETVTRYSRKDRFSELKKICITTYRVG